MVDFVVGFMFSENKKDVALISKTRPTWQAGKLNGIGGKMDPGESIMDALIREFKEETSVDSSPEDWTEFCLVENNKQNVAHFFYAFTDNVYKVKTVEDQEIGIYQVDNMPPNIIFNLNWLINLALDETVIFNEPVRILEGEKIW